MFQHRSKLFLPQRKSFVGGGAATVLDSANKGPNIVLSGGDLTAMVGPGQDFSNDSVRSTTSKSTGKHVWTYTVNAMNGGASNAGGGICDGDADLSTDVGGNGNLGIASTGAVFAIAGGFYMNNAGMTGAATDTWMYALDADNGLIWRRRIAATPGDWYGVYTAGVADPAAGTDGLDIDALGCTAPYFACLSIQHSVDSVTIGFNGTGYSGPSLPSGFSWWDV
jgi:hypothetical protein